MTTRHLHLLAALAVVSLPSLAQAQKVGPEFQVNQDTRADEVRPHVASDSEGNFMVVWENLDIGYFGTGTFGRTYDRDGNPLSDEFQIDVSGHPKIASTNGNFIVVWESDDDGDENILGQRYDRNGTPLGSEFQINSRPVIIQQTTDVASDASGNFVVVWGGRGSGSWGRQFDSDGNPLGDEFPLTIGPGGSVASDANGNFVVVWTTYRYSSDVAGQRYDSDGNPLGGEFQVNTYTTGYQQFGSVATTRNGGFVVVWTSGYFGQPGPDGDESSVAGQLYDSMGNRVGGEFQVNQYTTSNQWIADVTADKDGNFVVVWQNNTFYGGLKDGIYGRRYDAQGRPLTDEFQVNTDTSYDQNSASVASSSSGGFVVVWSRNDVYNYDTGIFGQRFSTDCQASVAVEADAQAPGDTLRAQVHIAHHRPKTVTVPWELRLLDANGQRIARRTTEPHTFEPGDVVDRSVEFRLPDDLAAGTYTLELAISGMAGTKGATTTFRVVRAE